MRENPAQERTVRASRLRQRRIRCKGWERQRCKKKRIDLFFECFPYVCPEPVLATARRDLIKCQRGKRKLRFFAPVRLKGPYGLEDTAWETWLFVNQLFTPQLWLHSQV